MKKIDFKDNFHWIIPSLLTAWGFVFGTFLIGLVFLIVSLCYVIYHFFWEVIVYCYQKRIKKYIEKIPKRYFIIFLLILIVSTLILLMFIFQKSLPKIYTLTEGYELEFNQKFNIDNIWEYWEWIYENQENEFITNDIWAKTLNTNAKKQRTYAMFQDLRKLNWTKLMLWRFNLKEWWKVWIRFVNTIWINSDTIRENHSNECVLQNYKTDNITMWYGHQVTKNKFLWGESTFQSKDLSEWIYYLVAKIWEGKFSCYYQKEWTEKVYQIIQDKDIIFENLGWPLLTKYIDDKNSYPELLEFELYTK